MEQSSSFDESTIRHQFDRRCQLALDGEAANYCFFGGKASPNWYLKLRLILLKDQEMVMLYYKMVYNYQRKRLQP